jgi:hypothetical protein
MLLKCGRSLRTLVGGHGRVSRSDGMKEILRSERFEGRGRRESQSRMDSRATSIPNWCSLISAASFTLKVAAR